MASLWDKIGENESYTSHQKSNPCMVSLAWAISLWPLSYDHWTTSTYVLNAYPAATWYVSCGFNFALQPTVVIPLFLWMVRLNHIKTQLRELRFSSNVTQSLFQLRGWQQYVEQTRGGALTLLIIGAHVSIIYSMLMSLPCMYIYTYSLQRFANCLCHLLKIFFKLTCVPINNLKYGRPGVFIVKNISVVHVNYQNKNHDT